MFSLNVSERFRLLILLVTVLVLVGPSFEPSVLAADSSASSARYRLVWNDDPASTVTIAWDQLEGEDPVVYYGPEDFGTDWEKYPSSQKPTRLNPGYREMNNHFAKLKKLKPDQAYYFVIKDSKSVGKRFWFRTAPKKPKPFTFVAGGDTKSQGFELEVGRLSNQMVAKLRPLFVLFDGDFTSGDGTNPDSWKLWFDDWMDQATTPDGRLTPIIPVHGNHENGEKDVIQQLFDTPYQDKCRTNIYYDISIAGKLLSIIVLNTQIETGGKQKAWLKKRLKKFRKSTFTMACYHKPFFPHTKKKRENPTQYENWAPLFDKYGLDLALDADSHMTKVTYPIRPSDEEGSHQGFIRDDEKGTVYIGEGSWGARPRPNNDDKPWTLRSGSFNQIKWIQVFPETDEAAARIDIRTIKIATTKDRKIQDTYVDKVGALDEADVFAIPEDITLFSTEPYGSVIRIPFVK
ncbi:hypothetical protein BVX97_05075 [bacterium E08(2017)]|nr:hypothetical protein BVX97_05075 [bacterium E08(2017)]